MAGKTCYGIFKVIATCTNCGNPVVVNGPLTGLACPSCTKEVEIPRETWRTIIGGYLQDYAGTEPGSGSAGTLMSGSLTLKYNFVRLPPPDPACPGCQTAWELDSVRNGTDGTLTCKKCGRTTPVFPPPAWLKGIVPSAAQIFFGEREMDEAAGAAPVKPDEEAEKPIALFCPQCNGGLVVTGKSERTFPCKYCGVDVYLPDGVWLKLHPAKVAKFWMIRFE
jgi:uncharacterized protein YbaR (Trm112 family)/predicted RNA-binding Zn-ribbon protein involved in translation (DUF1610 family)